MKYLPFIYIDIKSNRRLIIIAEMVFWPLLSIAALGLFTIFSGISFETKMFLFTGAMGWTIVYLSQHSLSRGFLGGVWHRAVKQIFSSPVDLKDLVIGHSLYGIIAATIGFLLLGIFTLLLFDFNIFSIGLYLPLFLLLGCMSGLIIGMFGISFVILFGLRVDVLAWILIDVAVFLSGLYYSITVFPSLIQTISYFFPLVYIFEGIRSALIGISPIQTLVKGYLVGFAWLAICAVLIKKIETYARKTGFYEKYG